MFCAIVVTLEIETIRGVGAQFDVYTLGRGRNGGNEYPKHIWLHSPPQPNTSTAGHDAPQDLASSSVLAMNGLATRLRGRWAGHSLDIVGQAFNKAQRPPATGIGGHTLRQVLRGDPAAAPPSQNNGPATAADITAIAASVAAGGGHFSLLRMLRETREQAHFVIRDSIPQLRLSAAMWSSAFAMGRSTSSLHGNLTDYPPSLHGGTSPSSDSRGGNGDGSQG